MNPLYRAAIHQLFLALDLPTPNDEESVLSLQVGPHLCHLAEHPTDHLLMFTRQEGQGDATANEQNLFSQDPCKPILGRDPESGERLLWNRQPLQLLDRAQIHHQLEQLVAAAEELR
ncbi:CesT family type III secretion system chaperone [Pseudomonas aeruginosa]|uniref:CesT family type III secretion system chaperone n=1 Tax=Pseudomonas aeruginosa TaxID=287 RepID=UPI00117B190D|nr:CesT family type III secretion system chaperone [Pseudomonas aeruginosa]TRO80854.1 CesT family type III secretion system chaperone [Pseudomonas aeruginosa]HEH9443683.1 CesT family type III secretion system chaperone [Pseudomonas aeruginosa]